MDRQTILDQFDHDMRVAIEYPDMRKDVLPGLVRFVRQGPGISFITHTALPPDALDAAVKQQLSYFNAIEQIFSWKVYAHDDAAALAERLITHGFIADDPEPVMALDLSNTPPALRAPVTADVRKLSAPAQIDDVVAIEAQVWGGDFGWLRRRMADHMALPGYLSVYVAYADGQPACAGWTYFHLNSRFAGLYGGSTLPQHRRRGLYTALLAARAQEAAARGYCFLLIEPTDMSRPIVSRHGFELLTQIQDFEQR